MTGGIQEKFARRGVARGAGGSALLVVVIVAWLVRPPASARAEEESEPAPAAEQMPTRPLLSDAEYAALAADLRKQYRGKPAEWPRPELDEGVEFVEFGTIPPPVYPEDNPSSKDKSELGKMLFFDPRLSGSGQIACASCHDPDLGWADGRTTAFGHGRKPLHRNTPAIINAAYQPALFWDGRADSLEQQAEHVLLNPDEMNATREGVERRLAQAPGYRPLFAKAFGDETISFERVVKAIATFERDIPVRASRFDRFLDGRGEAMSDEAIRGLHLFRTTARCVNCHHGPMLTDNRFHDLGLSFYGRSMQDLGRYEVTREAKDVGAFKTPTLRGVSGTSPYMHNGLFYELRQVMALYNAGMPTLKRGPGQADDPLFPTKSPHLRPLGLNRQDVEDVIAFMEAVSSPPLRIRPPVLPPDGVTGK